MGSRTIPPTTIDNFLNKTVFNLEPAIYIDLWSFVHLSVGMILGIFIKKWQIALAIFIGYEIIELLLRNISFSGETPANIIWDLVMGMAGYFIIRLFINYLE